MAVRARTDDLVAGVGMVYEDLEEVLTARVPAEVPGLLGALDDRARRGRFAIGYVAYEAAPGFDRALHVLGDPEPSALPLAWFAIFGRRVLDAPVAPPEPEPDSGSPWVARWSADDHEKAVERVRDRIQAGWNYQVNVTTHLQRSAVVDPFALYRQLATAQRGQYHAYLETDRWAVACGSPELFFERRGERVVTRPMKGTAARGRDPIEDVAQRNALVSSDKERAENVMIVDLLRNDLGRVARFGSVEVERLFALERYPTLWQLTSEVSAGVGPEVGTEELFRALFPCGSVTGAPKASAMAAICEVEAAPRGVYCGAVGVVEPPGDGEIAPRARFAVAIRTAVVDRTSGLATYGAGGGITYYAEPAAEWSELETKCAVLGRVVRRPGLIETLRFEPAIGWSNLDAHLARLARSAEYLGIPLDPAGALEALVAATAGLESASRVRLELRVDGACSVECRPLERVERVALRLAIDGVAQDESDPMLFHKVTDRARYEEASARHPDADDVILQNRRGEVTETTRANLAVRFGDRWVTPALDCGLLPGVERQRLIDAGVLREAVVRVEELALAEGLATVSSLRGWRDALLLGGSGAPSQ